MIYAARALRDFGDGFVAVLLPVYLTALGLGPFEVGVVATVALLGSALTTLGIGLLGARVDQRHLLVAASGLMVLTGIAFALSSDYWVVLLVAAIGTINPSAGTVSIFVPLEHALLSHAAADAERTRMFARYSLVGALAAAIGAFASASPELLGRLGIEPLAALRGMFLLYAMLGTRRRGLLPAPPHGAGPPQRRAGERARPVPPDRLPPGGALQRRRFCRRVRRSVAPRPVALSPVRPVADRRGGLLLLDRTVVGILLPGRRLAVAPHRAA